MGALRAYGAVFRQSFRRQASYRAATLAGLFTNTVFGIVLASVLRAVYERRSAIRGLEVDGALTMVFLQQGLLMVVGTFGWRELSDRVRTGDVATDLQRPVDPSLYWMASFSGQSVFSAFARGVPPFVAGALLFDLRLPEHWWTWFGFGTCVAGAIVVASRWWLIVNLVAFWLVDIRGVIQLAVVVQVFGQGSIVPLQFLPDGLVTVVRASPWSAMAQLPTEVFLERQGPGGVLAVQLVWAVVLQGVAMGMVQRATRKLVIQGG